MMYDADVMLSADVWKGRLHRTVDDFRQRARHTQTPISQWLARPFRFAFILLCSNNNNTTGPYL